MTPGLASFLLAPVGSRSKGDLQDHANVQFPCIYSQCLTKIYFNEKRNITLRSLKYKTIPGQIPYPVNV